MEELRKCPFCGGEADVSESMVSGYGLSGYNYNYEVFCVICGCRTRFFYNSEFEAIAAWNRRTQNIGKKECCVQGEEQEG